MLIFFSWGIAPIQQVLVWAWGIRLGQGWGWDGPLELLGVHFSSYKLNDMPDTCTTFQLIYPDVFPFVIANEKLQSSLPWDLQGVPWWVEMPWALDCQEPPRAMPRPPCAPRAPQAL